MAAVYYKFKSAKYFDSILIESQFISVACFRQLIFAKHLKKGRDFDINIFNAHTNEEYADEAALIAQYTSVLIQRVPGLPRKPIVIEGDEPIKVVDKKSEELPPIVTAVLKKPNEAAAFDLIPPELRCPLCKEAMRDAVLTGKCCFRSFCDECIRDRIVTKKICACGATNLVLDDLVPNKTLRDTISRVLESATSSSSESVGSMEHVQDVKKGVTCEVEDAGEVKVEKFGGEIGMKKKKNTTRVPVDIETEAYAGIPLAPSTFYPYWGGGMPLGIDGYMGYPSDPLTAQYYMMMMSDAVLPRDLSQLATNSERMNQGHPMNREHSKASHGHFPSPQRPAKRRRSSDMQEDDKVDRKHKSISGSGNNKRMREYLSTAELMNDAKGHHKFHGASNECHRRISYGNNVGEDEEEECHFKRRPSCFSSKRRDIEIV